jgi:hypothetical protein
MKNKDALYKANRIKKLASRIREELASNHDASRCQCPICEATYFVQRTMAFLESKLKDPEFMRSLHGKPQEGPSDKPEGTLQDVQVLEDQRGPTARQVLGEGMGASGGDAT